MKNYWEKMLQLPIIKSKKGAFDFQQKISNEDLVHTYGIDGTNKGIGTMANELWKYRKVINGITRKIRKEYENETTF